MDQLSQNKAQIHKCNIHSKAELPCCLAKQMLLNIVKVEKAKRFINVTSLRVEHRHCFTEQMLLKKVQ
jgi:hypothetical protein